MQGISIHAYRVISLNNKTLPLERVLDSISRAPLPDRIRIVGHSEVRLEAIEKMRDGCYAMDFVRFRFEHGPGKANHIKEITGFDFAPGEGFGEETAALYDPRSKHLIVQYNHHGVRAGRIAGYLSLIDDKADNQYELEPRFDADVENRLARKSIIKKFHFKVAARQISKADKKANVSLGSALSMANDSNSETIDIILSAGKGKRGTSLNTPFVHGALAWLNNRLGIDEESVQAMSVTGKDDPDSPSELLNLLGHRLKVEFNDLPLDSGLRYPRSARWGALVRARNGWKRILK